MPFPILKHLRASLCLRPVPSVTRDAEETLAVWGAAAFDHASEMSWKEDLGLVYSPRPGHWWSVRGEIGRRIGRQETEPRAEFAA